MNLCINEVNGNTIVKTELCNNAELVQENICSVTAKDEKLKPESCSIGTQTDNVSYQCGEKFVIRFKNFPEGTREEEILKFIYSTLDPGEIIYISIPYKAAHKLHGHGYVIVKNEVACEKFLKLNGRKVEGSQIEVYKGALKTANKKKSKAMERKLDNDPRNNFIQWKRPRNEYINFGGPTLYYNNLRPIAKHLIESDPDIEFLGYGVKDQ